MKSIMRKLLLAPVVLTAFSLTVNAQRLKAGARSGKQVATPSTEQGSKVSTNKNSRTTSGESTETPAITKPSGEHLSERQKGNIKQLEADLTAIKQGSQVTPEQKQNLKNSLTAMAEGATKPDPATVQKLADDLSVALADGRLSPSERYKLSEDLEAAMNSANISQAEFDKAVEDAEAILIASGVDKADVQTIVYDMKQMSAEGKKNIQAIKKRRQ